VLLPDPNCVGDSGAREKASFQRRVARKQLWPHFWSHDAKRRMAGNSGKVVVEAVPSAGTVVREWTRRIEESQAHARGSGLFLDMRRSTCRAKARSSVIGITPFVKP